MKRAYEFSFLPEKKFEYTPFDNTRQCFRLIRLLKRTGTTISCELFDAFFDEEDDLIPYEALSYTWGGIFKTETIVVNECSMAVTRNLYHALSHLQYEDAERILWVDAVCIDQESNRERNHQVPLMSKIYRRAEKVNVWLGQSHPLVEPVMQSLKALQNASLTVPCRSWKATDPRWRALWYTTFTRDMTQNDELLTSLRKGADAIWTMPWFRRVWILQEIGFASRAEIFCGSASVSGVVFALLPTLLNQEIDKHCQAVLDIFPGPSRQDSWWASNRNMSILLRRFRSSQAGISRDLLFALVGMCDDKDLGFAVDYELSEAAVVNLIHKSVFGEAFSEAELPVAERRPDVRRCMDRLDHAMFYHVLRCIHKGQTRSLHQLYLSLRPSASSLEDANLAPRSPAGWRPILDPIATDLRSQGFDASPHMLSETVCQSDPDLLAVKFLLDAIHTPIVICSNMIFKLEAASKPQQRQVPLKGALNDVSADAISVQTGEKRFAITRQAIKMLSMSDKVEVDNTFFNQNRVVYNTLDLSPETLELVLRRSSIHFPISFRRLVYAALHERPEDMLRAYASKQPNTTIDIPESLEPFIKETYSDSEIKQLRRRILDFNKAQM